MKGDTEMVYQWKTGARYSVSAEVAASVMNELSAQNNLSAKALVDASRPEDAPLHNEFEWDDGIAAEKWREQQGRVMIAMVAVVQEGTEQKEPIRAYFHIEDNQPRYEPIVTIISSEEKQAKLFKLAIKELQSFRDKYQSIKEFTKLFADIREFEEKAS